MSKVAFIRIGCLVFILGILCASWQSDGLCTIFAVLVVLAVVVGASVSGMIVTRRYITWALVPVIFIFGAAYFTGALSAALHAVEPGALAEQQWTGWVEYPETSLHKQRLIVRTQKPLRLRIFVYARRYPVFNVGDQITFRCAAQKPEPIEGFAFDKYAARRGITLMCVYPTITRIGTHAPGRSWLARWTAFYDRYYREHFPHTESSLLSAMVTNHAGEFPADARESFSRTGLVHVISISGLHISLLVAMVELMLIALGIGPRSRVLIGAILLGAYITVLGFPAAAVRATLMGMSSLVARAIGRPYQGLHVLCLVAAFMAVQNPLIVWYDMGFQLSFLALAGIMLGSQLIEQVVHAPLAELGYVRATMLTTLFAQALTWPLVAYHFHMLTLTGAIVNIIVLPLTGPWLALALLAPVVSVLPVVGFTVSATLFMISRGIVVITRLGSVVPYASVAVPDMTFTHVLSTYVLTFAGLFGIRYLGKHQHSYHHERTIPDNS